MPPTCRTCVYLDTDGTTAICTALVPLRQFNLADIPEGGRHERCPLPEGLTVEEMPVTLGS